MLLPAIQFEEEIKNKYKNFLTTQRAKYYTCYGWTDYKLNIKSDDWDEVQFVSVNVDREVIGYFSGSLSRHTNRVTDICIIKLCETNIHKSFNSPIDFSDYKPKTPFVRQKELKLPRRSRGENYETFNNDLRMFIDVLFNYYKIGKIKFSVAIGNPAEKIYDYFIRKYDGRVIGVSYNDGTLTNGEKVDMKYYEIFRENYLKVKNNGSKTTTIQNQ